MFPPLSFFFLTVFLTSFVFLPPSNVNSAQHLIRFFTHSISFSGVEKADFRSFFLFVWVPPFFFLVCSFVLLKNNGSLTCGNSVSCNCSPCFYRPLFAGEGLWKEIENLFQGRNLPYPETVSSQVELYPTQLSPTYTGSCMKRELLYELPSLSSQDHVKRICLPSPLLL